MLILPNFDYRVSSQVDQQKFQLNQKENQISELEKEQRIRSTQHTLHLQGIKNNEIIIKRSIVADGPDAEEKPQTQNRLN